MNPTIEARGIRVHNLKNVDVSVPIGQLTVITGVSGSGKSSLAFDTLYAEGQRRYVDCFSTWARQHLEQLPRPDVDRVDQLPPAVAIRQHRRNTSPRATVATATEIDDYLRLLFSRVGQQRCPNCSTPVTSRPAESLVDEISGSQEDARVLIGFELNTTDAEETADLLRSEGFNRIITGDRTHRVDNLAGVSLEGGVTVVLDRVTTKSPAARLSESLESAFSLGQGRCVVLIESEDSTDVVVDDRSWIRQTCFEQPACPSCFQTFEPIEPQTLSFNSPRGACAECSGHGTLSTFEFDKLVPNPALSLEEGAIVPWTTPAYRHELDELLALAPDYGVPVGVPFHELTDEHRRVITDGVPERDFGGLRGFFGWLERNRYKKGVGVFLSRWRSWKQCSSCTGTRLNPAGRNIEIEGTSFTTLAAMTVQDALDSVGSLHEKLGEDTLTVAEPLIAEIVARLEYLSESGIGYLTLSRSMSTLSAGESQRVALTAALGSSLVNTLYVLDEPTAGLHPADTTKIISAVARLRDAGNTIIVVEHDAEFIQTADQVIDVGPGAGAEGGRIIVSGSVDEMMNAPESVTGEWLRTTNTAESEPRTPRRPRGHIRLSGAQTNNIQNLTVDFPLGVLCVVTGVSGSGKSSLVEQTLYPAMCRTFGRECDVRQIGTWESVTGVEELANVVLVDQKPIGRTPRSIPATYMDLFGDIRSLFAETPEAKKRGFTAGTFSFNTATGGRCPKCEGAGFVTIDMQFMADVEMVCPECDGARFRPEVLEARYRGLTIADILMRTADEAFLLFRGRGRLQKKLKVLRDAGLGYLPLGQPATTLSGGEAQRLKMASHLAGLALKAQRQTRADRFATLFILDEPSVGLHGTDVAVLLQCFDALLEAGHSLIVVEHNHDIIRRADHIVDLGPGAGRHGGRLVATGTPAEIVDADESQTGSLLRGMR